MDVGIGSGGNALGPGVDVMGDGRTRGEAATDGEKVRAPSISFFIDFAKDWLGDGTAN